MDEQKKVTLVETRRQAEVLVQLAEILDPFDREQQLRILEAACVMLHEDESAAMFRGARLAADARRAGGPRPRRGARPPEAIDESSPPRSGADIRRMREAAQVTQAAFAQMLGVHPSILSLVETGKKPLPAGMFDKAQALTSGSAQSDVS